MARARKRNDEAATLRSSMQDAIRKDLPSQYQPELEIPHELMSLLMQMDRSHGQHQEAQ